MSSVDSPLFLNYVVFAIVLPPVKALIPEFGDVQGMGAAVENDLADQQPGDGAVHEAVAGEAGDDDEVVQVGDAADDGVGIGCNFV